MVLTYPVVAEKGMSMPSCRACSRSCSSRKWPRSRPSVSITAESASIHSRVSCASASFAAEPNWARRWWRRQTPVRQDRFAMLAPFAAVLLFLAAIVTAFGYLRLEEMDREQEAVKRDVEYAQQRVRLRLLERQEQLMRLSRD